MEVRVGYEQTEVGVIPADWTVNRLGEIGTLSKGKGLLKEDIKTNGTVPAIPYTALYTDFSELVDYARIKWFVDDTAQTVVLNEPCVLIASSSNMAENTGKASALTGNAAVAIGREVIVFRSAASASYVSYLLSTSFYRKQTLVLARGTTIKHLYPATFVDYKIGLPPLPEQRAIAAALSDVDALLDGLERLIDKKRDLKQAAMQQLLTGRTRLPGFSGVWDAIQLGDVADPAQRWGFTGGPFGSNLKSSDYTDDGVRIIQLQNIGDGSFLDDYKIFTSRAKADELISCNIYPGEIILSKMGDPVARACIIPAKPDRYVMCSDGIRLAVDQLRFCTFFIYTVINAREFRDKAANAGTGSTRKRIGLTELRSLELKCPSLPEQTAIANILSDMDAELSALEARRDKTGALKAAMMQELLTGRTRLVEPVSDAPATSTQLAKQDKTRP